MEATTDTLPPLHERMEALAKDHPRADELIEKANALKEATEGFYGEPQTVSVGTFVKRWAQARLLWSQITGEPLI